MLKDYTVCLNLAYQARNEEDALEIAQIIKNAIQSAAESTSTRTPDFPYKVEVDIDDLEEA